MEKSEIIEVFKSANIEIPEEFLSFITLENIDYDDLQSWCCGLDVRQDLSTGGVIVEEYCRKGRGDFKPVWLVDKNGKCILLGKCDPLISFTKKEIDELLLKINLKRS